MAEQLAVEVDVKNITQYTVHTDKLLYLLWMVTRRRRGKKVEQL